MAKITQTVYNYGRKKNKKEYYKNVSEYTGSDTKRITIKLLQTFYNM